MIGGEAVGGEGGGEGVGGVNMRLWRVGVGLGRWETKEAAEGCDGLTKVGEDGGGE